MEGPQELPEANATLPSNDNKPVPVATEIKQLTSSFKGQCKVMEAILTRGLSYVLIQYIYRKVSNRLDMCPTTNECRQKLLGTHARTGGLDNGR